MLGTLMIINVVMKGETQKQAIPVRNMTTCFYVKNVRIGSTMVENQLSIIIPDAYLFKYDRHQL